LKKISIYGRLRNYKVSVEVIKDNKARIFTSYPELYKLYNLDIYDRNHYLGWVDLVEFDCVWEERDYSIVNVLKGELKVSEDSYKDERIDRFYRSRRQKVIYNGKHYEHFQGVNHDYRYQLYSYDIESQNEGFLIMKPGMFALDVKPDLIELEYTHDTWCSYKGMILVPDSILSEKWWITPYSRDNYASKDLEGCGFEIKNTRYMKLVDEEELDSIWIVKRGVGKSANGYFETEVVRGIIAEDFFGNYCISY